MFGIEGFSIQNASSKVDRSDFDQDPEAIALLGDIAEIRHENGEVEGLLVGVELEEIPEPVIIEV